MMPTDSKTPRTASREQKQQAIETLRRLITPETTLYILLRRRSRTGNKTVAFVRATPQQTILTMTVSIAQALDLTYDQTQEGIVLRQDAGIGAIVDGLSRLLFGTNGEIAVEWI